MASREVGEQPRDLVVTLTGRILIVNHGRDGRMAHPVHQLAETCSRRAASVLPVWRRSWKVRSSRADADLALLNVVRNGAR
jgi:hypothetical protein